MQRLEFTPEEVEVLREVLQHCASEIDVEVFRTDMRDFREMLKHRREVLQRILAKVSATPAAV